MTLARARASADEPAFIELPYPIMRRMIKLDLMAAGLPQEYVGGLSDWELILDWTLLTEIRRR